MIIEYVTPNIQLQEFSEAILDQSSIFLQHMIFSFLLLLLETQKIVFGTMMQRPASSYLELNLDNS